MATLSPSALIAIAMGWAMAGCSTQRADVVVAPDKKPTVTKPTAVVTKDLMTFTAVLRIEAKPGGKRLQAVTLEPETGAIKEYIIDYRATGWWRPFEGQRVIVTGEHWIPDPESQQVMTEHFTVDTLVVAPAANNMIRTPIYSKLGPQKTWVGHFESAAGEPGSKQADDRWTVFVDTAGTRHRVVSGDPAAKHFGKQRQIVARALTASKYAAHSGEPMLWIKIIRRPPKETTP